MALSAKDARAVRKAAIQGLGNTAAGKAAGARAVAAGGGVSKEPVEPTTQTKESPTLQAGQTTPTSPPPAPTGMQTVAQGAALASPNTQVAKAGTVAPAPQGKYGSPVTGYFDSYEQARDAALGALKQRGEAPSDMGKATSAISEVIEEPQDTSPVDSVLETDSDWQTISKQALEYLNPVRQRDTLLQEYDRLYAKSGIEKLDQEIIDAESIIDGTEDDIRNEVQMAGGFATDSQVQAMALARNKSLLKRYNQLVATRESAQKRLDTMMTLTAKDKEMAMERANMGFNLMFKMAEFKERAINNVREAFNNLVANVGYGGAYLAYSRDPKQLARIENLMGIEPGGLKSLSTYKKPLTEMEQADLDLKRQQILTEQAQRAKIVSETDAVDTKAQQRIQSQTTKAATVIDKVHEALNMANMFNTGYAANLKDVKGTGAYNLSKTVQTIQANIGFAELQAMREASPTGGALGQVAIQELEALQSTIASLDTGQTLDVLQNSLYEVEEHYVNWLATVNPTALPSFGYEITPEGKIVRILD